MEKENLHFKIGLSGSYSKKSPSFNVILNGINFLSSKIIKPSSEIEYFEFDAEVAEGQCELVIELTDKTTYDTVLDKDGKIIDDLLLNIESIEIDEIDLGTLLWTASDYKPNYPESFQEQSLKIGNELAPSVKNCVNLGWNGKWILPFTSPFYIWLLENI